MSEYTWRLPAGQVGLFSDLSSWTDESTGQQATSIPGIGDTVDIGGGAVVAGTGTVDAMNLSGVTTIEGTVDASVSYSVSTSSVTYGLDFGYATLDIAAGGVFQAPVFFIGGTNKTGVQVNVEAGGTLQSVGLTTADSDLSIKIGAATGSQAAVDVSGTGASLDSGGWAVWIGEAGSGTLTIADGAQGGDGTLDNTGTLDFFYSTNIGAKTGSDGTLIVDGIGSTYTVSAVLAVGRASGANGVLVLSDGGTLVATGVQSNNNSNVRIGESFGATGTVTVETGATLNAGPAGMVVGDAGSGTLVVQQGGTVLTSSAGFSDVEGALVLGWSFSSNPAQTGSGQVTVDGAGSLIKANGQILVGDFGSGTLLIENAGTVEATATEPQNYDNIRIGSQVGSTGAVTVTSGGLLDAGPAALAVGLAGTGTLVVQGGTVFASDAGYPTVDSAFVIGWSFAANPTQTGTGFVTVDGVGSLIRSAGAIDIGRDGSGTLLIENAATVEQTATAATTNANVVIGSHTGSSGSVTVTGVGSLLNVGSGRLSVGNDGAATLLVNQGGTVQASAAGYTDAEPAVRAGLSSDGSGIITVDGAGSTLAANGAVWVGENGAGSLTISNNAIVSAGGANDGGTGLIVSEGTGTGSVLLNAGTLNVSDNGEINALGSVTLENLGQFSVGGTLTVAAGGSLSGDGHVSGAVDVDGMVALTGGSQQYLELGGAVSGSGTIALEATSGTLKLDSTVAAGLTVQFTSSDDALTLGTPLGMNGLIEGFATGDVISFAGSYTKVSESFTGTTMTVTGDGATIAQLDFSRGYNESDTSVSDTSGVVAIQTTIPEPVGCFLAGSKILTARGEVAVQDLRVGDLAMTLSGLGPALQAVRWIGHSHLRRDRHPQPDRVIPIRIRAGAFADGTPHRDLWLSPDHSVRLRDDEGSALVPVHQLVNGATILPDPTIDAIHYVHVELDQHDLLLADGLACESYLDTGNRAAFTNGGPTVALHPDFWATAWSERACFPLLLGGARVAAEHARLAGRSAELGHCLTDDPDLHLFADGLPVAVNEIHPGLWRGLLPAGARILRLRSRSVVPRHLDRGHEDGRRLGIPILDVQVGGCSVALDSPLLAYGFHLPEQDGETRWRWTDGDAVMQLPDRPSECVQIRAATGWRQYWIAPARDGLRGGRFVGAMLASA